MGLSQLGLGRLYLLSVLLGVLLGFVYDLLRITRVFCGVHYTRFGVRRLRALSLPLIGSRERAIGKRTLSVVLFFEDFFFCLFGASALILLLYEENDGIFRLPVPFLSAVGFFFYRVTVGKGVLLFSEIIAFGAETVFRYVVWFALFPFRQIFRGGRALFLRLRRFFAERREFRARRRYTRSEIGRIDSDACGLIPARPRVKKPGGRMCHAGKAKKKTVQPRADLPHISRTADRRLHRRVREQRHAVQRVAR